MNEIRAQEDKACARRGRACLPGHAAVAFASARAEHFLMLRTYREGAPAPALFFQPPPCHYLPAWPVPRLRPPSFTLPPLCTSRVVMIHALTALVLALPLSASALHSDSSFRRRHAGFAHKPAYMRRAANYTLKDHFVGEDFLCVPVCILLSVGADPHPTTGNGTSTAPRTRPVV